MQNSPTLPDAVARAGRIAGLALLAAGLWWGWFAWDDSHQHDPTTGEVTGPYESWQVIGCAACGFALIVAAERLVPPRPLVLVTSLSFTIAWALTAVPSDRTGLAAVGAVLVLAGTLLGTSAAVATAWTTRRLIARRAG